MLRFVVMSILVSTIVVAARSQSVPKELLSKATRLELDKPTSEVNVGGTVVYRVTLKNARGQAIAAASNLELKVQTPSGEKTVQLAAGSSSTTFEWNAQTPGVSQMTVSAGQLHPASGLVLVVPSLKGNGVAPKAEVHPNIQLQEKASGIDRKHVGAAASIGAQTVASSAVSTPSSAAAAQSVAKRIRLFVVPLPVYGDAIDHIWKATVSVASLGDGDVLLPVSNDVAVHLSATSGQLSATDIVIQSGQFGNFQNPIILTTDHAGKASVEAVSSLGSTGPVDVEYLQPPPSQLRLTVGTPVLAGNGNASASVQVCLVDASGAPTSSSDDVQVTLTAPGVLASPVVPIHHNSVCTDPTQWTAGPGAMRVVAAASGLKSDAANAVFPAFPSYFVWIAALGGLAGAILVNLNSLSSRGWWRSLLLGAGFGMVCYLLARFGAVALPEGIDIQKIPVVSGVGSLLIGILGGLFGRKIFKLAE